jgi:hypothetical protein
MPSERSPTEAGTPTRTGTSALAATQVARARICKPLKDPESIPSMPGRHGNPLCRTGPPGYRLAASIPRNRFLGSLNVYKYGLYNDARNNKGTSDSKDDRKNKDPSNVGDIQRPKSQYLTGDIKSTTA